MSLLHASSPHYRPARGTGRIMTQVGLASLPGLAALCYHFGWGPLIQVLWCLLWALIMEALVLRLRGRPAGFHLADGSALVTGLLLGLALPPYAPWWLGLVGVLVAIVFAKHLYGGLGQNLFNPAMVAYALLLVAFPLAMTQWAAPISDSGNSAGAQALSDPLTALEWIFAATPLPDALSGATPLDAFKHKGALTTEELRARTPGLAPAIDAWQSVNAAFLLGGLYLLARGIIGWQIPLAMLLTIFMLSGFFYGSDPSNFATPMLHLSTGATLLGAFFIATDPVTAATSNRGKLIYGAGIGLFVYLIRTQGGYPDAVAFAVLLMNLCVPLLDYYSRPRSYGHKKPARGIPR